MTDPIPAGTPPVIAAKLARCAEIAATQWRSTVEDGDYDPPRSEWTQEDHQIIGVRRDLSPRGSGKRITYIATLNL